MNESDREQKKIKEERDARFASTLLIGLGLGMIGTGILFTFLYKNPVMLCLSGIGLASVLTGSVMSVNNIY